MALVERLARPEQTLDLSGLAASWFETAITCRMAGFAALVSDHGLLGRIRGALGEQLKLSASQEALEGSACVFEPPSAFDALFRKQGRIEPGLEYPSPWVLAADHARGDLLIRLSLFGFAADWAPAAAEALAGALRHRVVWTRDAKQFLPRIRLTARSVAPVPLAAATTGGELALRFLSPVCLSKSSALEKPQSLVTMLAARLTGLARWHDASLALDRVELLRAVEKLSFIWSGPEAVHWVRGSARQDQSFKMGGVLGTLLVSGPSEAMALAGSLLALGARTHMGADIAYGCGRFVIEP